MALRLASDSFFNVVVWLYAHQNVNEVLVKEWFNMFCGKTPEKWRARCNSKRNETHRFYERAGFTKNKSQHVFEYGL